MLEAVAAVSIPRAHLPNLRIRVVDIVDPIKLQLPGEHPHGLSDVDYNDRFTRDVSVIFVVHADRWLFHRPIYRRANQDRIQVRGYKEESTISTPFYMTVLNDLDRFHLMTHVIDRVPRIGDQGDCLQRQRQDMPSEHRRYIERNGRDLPAIRESTRNS